MLRFVAAATSLLFLYSCLESNGVAWTLKKQNTVYSYSYSNSYFQHLEPKPMDYRSLFLPLHYSSDEHYLSLHSNASNSLIYQPEYNHWYKPFRAVNIEFDIWNDLSRAVSLCKKITIVFDYDTNDAWVLDTKQIQLKKLKLLSSLPSDPARGFVSTKFSVVALKQNETQCSCKESAIAFGGCLSLDPAKESMCYNDLWELHCHVDEELYEWRLLDINKEQKKPMKRAGHVAISAQGKTLMYIAGGANPALSSVSELTKVWQFSMLMREWKCISESSPIFMFSIFKSFYVTGHNVGERYFVFHSGNFQFAMFDLEKQLWIADTLLLNTSYTQTFSVAVEYESTSLLVFSREAGGVSVRKVLLEENGLHVVDIRKPSHPYLPLLHEASPVHSCETNSDFTFTVRQQFKEGKNRSVTTIMGVFDSRQRFWTVIGALASLGDLPLLEGHTATWVENVNGLIIYGGREKLNSWQMNDRTFVFRNAWISQVNMQETCFLASRFYHSSISINSTSLLVFGGLAQIGKEILALADLWVLNFFNGSTCTCSRIARSINDNSVWPSGRFGHLALRVNSDVLFHGGIVSNQFKIVSLRQCSNQMWAFSLKTFTWKALESKNFESCFGQATLLGSGVLVFGQGYKKVYVANQSVFDEPSSLPNNRLWIYDLISNVWLKLEETIVPSGLILVQDFLSKSSVALLGIHFLVIVIGCPKGMYSPDFPTQFCSFCPVGTYSDQVGQKSCFGCPEGTTTTFSGSTLERHCNKCRNASICVHGKCLVALAANSSSRKWFCICYRNFYHDIEGKCTVPSRLREYSAVVIGVILLVTLYLIRQRSEISFTHFNSNQYLYFLV